MSVDKLLKLIGDNPGKLKRLYTVQHGENCLTSFEITIVADDMKMIFEEVEYLK